eukprot:3963974-Pyramimonas_sp.AAC.2
MVRGFRVSAAHNEGLAKLIISLSDSQLQKSFAACLEQQGAEHRVGMAPRSNDERVLVSIVPTGARADRRRDSLKQVQLVFGYWWAVLCCWYALAEVVHSATGHEAGMASSASGSHSGIECSATGAAN